jgi:hypothetical protein
MELNVLGLVQNGLGVARCWNGRRGKEMSGVVLWNGLGRGKWNGRVGNFTVA